MNELDQFIKHTLKIKYYLNKIVIRRLSWGIDFLGYIVLPHYILPRTKTKRRIFQKLKIKIYDENFNQILQSYLGYLSHANSFKISEQIRNYVWLCEKEALDYNFHKV